MPMTQYGSKQAAAISGFKPCKSCPSPAKCMKAGECLGKMADKSKLAQAMGLK